MNLGDFRDITKDFGEDSPLFVRVRVDGKEVDVEVKSLDVRPSSMIGAYVITLNG